MKKYSRLILVLALLLIGCVIQKKNEPFSWGTHSCVFTGEYDAPGILDTKSYPPEYNGTFRCTNPDGSNLTCPNTNQPAGRAEFTARVTFPRDVTEKNFWSNMGCSPSSTTTPKPTATAVPTATATPFAAPAAASTPLLTGDVTACNVRDGYINFKLVDGAPSISGDQVVVTMNGTQVNCTVPSSKVLSCALPFGVIFPAAITVGLGDSMVNQFSFNGEGCGQAEPPKDGSDGGGDIVPPPCLGDVCP